jgi:hypothetical protein
MLTRSDPEARNDMVLLVADGGDSIDLLSRPPNSA